MSGNRAFAYRLNLALESVGIGTWTWDILRDQIIWDEFTHKIFGDPRRKVASYSRFLEKVSKKDLAKLEREIGRVFNEGGSLNSHFSILRSDGYEKQVCLKAKLFRGCDYEPIHLTGIVIDKSYDLSNSILLNKFFSLPLVLFCVADLKGNFKILNSAWSDLLGYSISELKSKPFLSFVHPQDRDRTQIEYQMIMVEDGYRAINFTNRYISKEDGYKVLMWNAIKTKGDNHIYATAIDITDSISSISIDDKCISGKVRI